MAQLKRVSEMATAPSVISLEDYLSTSYSPDCEYVDGVVAERNVGQGKHAYTQTELAAELRPLAKDLSLLALVEQRVKVSETRVRVPDICIVKNLDEVISEAPVLCVEVFSPDDRWRRLNVVIGDYLSMGVGCVWVVDPYQRRAWLFEGDQPPAEIQDGVLRADSLGIRISLAKVLPPES